MLPMRTTLIALIMAASLLAACSKKSTVAAKSSDPVTQKLQELSGSGATDCGRTSQTPDQIQKASDCAMSAAKDKRPFYVGYDMPGLTVGIAGNSQGKLFSLQAETAENAAGGKPQIQTAPCPAELRVAQSGRLTCMTPGAMGAGTPHGNMGPVTGENPHGGMMSMPPLGTQNPHGTTQPSHPPAGKTPPKP